VRPCCRAAGQPCVRAVVRPGSRAAGRPCTQRLKLGLHSNKTKGCSGGGGGGGGGPAASGSGCPAAGVRGGGGGSAGRSRQRRARRDRLLRVESAIDLGAAAAVRCSARRPPDRSKAAESRPYGLCADRPYRAPRSALPGITRTTSLQGGAGKQRAAIAGTKSKESRANACHRSSHRVENLAVSLRPREQASPLGADTHIAAIATHTSRQITFKY